VQLPSDWVAMTANEIYKKVTLASTSSEYQDVAQKFALGGIKSVSWCKIYDFSVDLLVGLWIGWWGTGSISCIVLFNCQLFNQPVKASAFSSTLALISITFSISVDIN